MLNLSGGEADVSMRVMLPTDPGLVCHRRQRQLPKVQAVIAALREELAWARQAGASVPARAANRRRLLAR